MRTIIEIPDDVIESLDRITADENRSRASLIREAIAEYLGHKALPSDGGAFGLWKDRGKDALEYQDKLRRDWDTR